MRRRRAIALWYTSPRGPPWLFAPLHLRKAPLLYSTLNNEEPTVPLSSPSPALVLEYRSGNYHFRFMGLNREVTMTRVFIALAVLILFMAGSCLQDMPGGGGFSGGGET